MNYIELKIDRPTDPEEEDILIAELAAIGFESFLEEDDVLLAYIPEEYFFREKLGEVELLKTPVENSGLRISLIEDQNWNAVWESNYHPVKIAGRCFIRAPFHDPDPDVDFDIVLKPKMAFGTAHHETTALMIGMLLDADVEGKSVLDMGCGTAVLAILAAKKGASHVTAIDNDEWAYKNAIENADINAVSDIKILLGDATLSGKDNYDLIMANINKNILLADMKAYSDALHDKAHIYFSGFYEEDLEDVKKEANKKGLIFVSHDAKNKWVVAIFKKQ